MRLMMLAAWGALCIAARGRTRAALLGAAYTAGIAVSMASQLWLLRLDGHLNLSTGLPLHLCGLMGVLSPLLVWRCPAWLYELSFFLGAPCAALTLCFPAVVESSHPLLMRAAFYRLHALLALAPAFLIAQGKPPPRDPKRAFALANGYLLFVCAFNRVFGCNYMFLARAPTDTPLAALFARGAGAYILSLELITMLVMTLMRELSRLYLRKYDSIYPV